MFNNYATQAREFSQAAFWFWNDQLSEIEIARQLDDFQAHGVHAFVIHPRAGLPRNLEWMGDELLGYMRFATDSEHVCAVAILGQDDRLPWESARVCFENQIPN